MIWEVILVAMLIFAYPVVVFVIAVACDISRSRRDSPPVLGLTWDEGRGRYRHAETGPIIIPDDYSAIVTAEQMWRGP